MKNKLLLGLIIASFVVPTIGCSSKSKTQSATAESTGYESSTPEPTLMQDEAPIKPTKKTSSSKKRSKKRGK